MAPIFEILYFFEREISSIKEMLRGGGGGGG